VFYVTRIHPRGRQAIHGRSHVDSSSKNPQKKPGVGRVFVKQRKKRATAYPAEISGPGRRAREVMPAAMRALVGPASIMEGVFITARTLAAIAAQCKPRITRPVRR
jgi:hypothetical protein